jgi:hypothetical protein
MEFLAQIVTGLTAAEVIAALAVLGIWPRLEHRLTRLETKIEDLPCPGKNKDLCKN